VVIEPIELAEMDAFVFHPLGLMLIIAGKTGGNGNTQKAQPGVESHLEQSFITFTFNPQGFQGTKVRMT